MHASMFEYMTLLATCHNYPEREQGRGGGSMILRKDDYLADSSTLH